MTEVTPTTCGCLASLEVLMGPHTGAMVAPTSSAIAIGRSKKFVGGTGRSKKFVGGTGLLLASDFDVSSRHASIARDTSLGRFVVVDVGSTNGTKINEAPIAPRTPTPLRDGDTLTTGASLLAFRIDVVCAACAVPKPSEVDIVVAAEAPLEHEECVVCHGSLYGLSFEERHLHVNACLDSQPKAKKAKKLKSINQEQVEFALALSKSLVDDELEASVNKTMLTRDLAAIDAQIAALQKQRAKILKQLQKSEKQTKRAATSRVLPPDAVLTALHDSYDARAFLYPHTLALPSRRQPRGRRWRPASASEALVWWSKAAQGDQWTAVDYLVPNVLPTTIPVATTKALSEATVTSPSEAPVAETTATTDESMEAAVVSSSATTNTSTPPAIVSVPSRVESPSSHEPQDLPTEPDILMPATIASIFPQWQDDVAFIDAQTDASALRDALQALTETREATTDVSTLSALQFFAAHMEARLALLQAPI